MHLWLVWFWFGLLFNIQVTRYGNVKTVSDKCKTAIPFSWASLDSAVIQYSNAFCFCNAMSDWITKHFPIIIYYILRYFVGNSLMSFNTPHFVG